MNNNPLVSILVPLYNHEKYISQCLDSIIEDSYVPKEIVIINDGSTDGSAEVVEEWVIRHRDIPGIKIYFNNCKNMGLCKTLNELVSIANGLYVAILASDDFLLPGGILARVKYLSKNPDKNAVFGDCIVVDNLNNKICESGIEDFHRGRKSYLSNDRLLEYELVIRWCVPGPVFMARKDVYKIVGPYDESIYVEDWDFYLRLNSKKMLGFIDYPVAGYRIHNASTISRFDNKKYQDSIYKIVEKNAGSYNGLKRLHFFGYKLRKKRDQCKEEKNIIGYLSFRLACKFVFVFTNISYKIVGAIVNLFHL